jgi:hypothetical protein
MKSRGNSMFALFIEEWAPNDRLWAFFFWAHGPLWGPIGGPFLDKQCKHAISPHFINVTGFYSLQVKSCKRITKNYRQKMH